MMIVLLDEHYLLVAILVLDDNKDDGITTDFISNF